MEFLGVFGFFFRFGSWSLMGFAMISPPSERFRSFYTAYT